MNLERDPEGYYEEYRGYVIASSKNNDSKASNADNIVVYYKSDSPEYTFIASSAENQNLSPEESLMQKINDARSFVDWNCCKDRNKGIEKPGTGLPIINLEGTDFYIDVTRFQLIDVFNSNNLIPFSKMEDHGDCYRFDYNTTIKNIPEYPNRRDAEIEIPEFVVMDPEGMARKYSITVDEVKNKTDFDFMVDQKEFDLRAKIGRLPTIDIAGHLFYVDMRMDKLRPKNDFGAYGISFSDIDDHFSEERGTYLIPYDPKKHEFRDLDYENVTSIPKDLIVIEFPFQQVLDPVGWNRQGGWDIKEDLKHIGVKSHFTAKVVPWEQTYIVDIIKDNLDRLKEKENKKEEVKIEPGKKKGRTR